MSRIILVFLLVAAFRASAADIAGQQPNAAIDTRGTVRIAYGEGEKIFCITSIDNGVSFSAPVLVGQIRGMHLGHTRGPQIASSKAFSLITAMDKEGNIHSFKLNHLTKAWAKTGNANDSNGSAPEGLMALTADKEDNFYAVWLDLRLERKNNICFSSFSGKTADWSKNIMVYRSPDEHVCECCRPNISYGNNKLVIGFRNWLAGSRDIYYSVSADKGKTFSAARKSGTGTWKLNACPMDGGGLVINDSGKISTAWRRNGDVYYWSENQPEQRLGAGRDVSMTQLKGRAVVSWQENNRIKTMDMTRKTISEIGTGVSPRIYLLNNGKTLCLWEDNKTIKYRLI